ncbi:MAG TPA: cell division topological specificity factor MinE [Dictyoglomaceae bacterium]|mgnify:CR=1 FL=1|nr:cell division topological specificity factor MinE [Dictyoglomaceae bacterium]HOL39629.1 cell division topological specificity factor MinE [Dictyoglomaceae bacterium]HOP95149.1 cell division topological specificity factor MinE [Dictyoglomaceae bacterium]HPP15201.1 cell division topological specificity factor MinE [Dictyoglomaceae bacterium]HPU42607.1 cell division topological specificity factor MinE [Dictyoglomaceae bacterium]
MLLNSFWGKRTSSKDIAKERLQLVLVYDRAQIDPSTVDLLKEDLVKTVSKYLAFDPANIKVELSQENNTSILRIDVPFKTKS